MKAAVSLPLTAEDPGYAKIAKIYRSHQVAFTPVPIDKSGVSVEALQACGADVVHCSPSHHYPTGIVMPVSRRYTLLGWATEQKNRYIIEDDFDSEFRMTGKPLPTLQSMDTTGRVIYMNTFTKSLSSTIITVIGYMLFMSVGYILPKSVVLLNIIGFLIFFSQGAFNMTMIVMLNNTIEYDEVRFHERHDSIISAVRSFATKLASAVDQAVVALILIISSIYAISQKISGLEIKAGTGELTSENVIVQADKFIQTADAGQRFILRLGIVAVPVISIGAAYILIKRKYIIDERKYEELVAEIKSTNKK